MFSVKWEIFTFFPRDKGWQARKSLTGGGCLQTGGWMSCRDFFLLTVEEVRAGGMS